MRTASMAIVEAVARRVGVRPPARGTSAVAAEHGEQQVACSVLVGRPGARTAALHVHDDHRQLGHHAQPHRFALRQMPGPLLQWRRFAGERGARPPRHGRDFVLRLEGPDVEILSSSKLMENVAGGGDRIPREIEGFAARRRRPTPGRVASLPVILRYLPAGSLALPTREGGW